MGFLDLLSWIREGFATGQDVDEPDPEAFDSIVDAAEGESVRAELLAGAGEHTKVPLAEHLDEGEQPHHMLRAGEVVAVDESDSIARKYPGLETVIVATDQRLLIVLGGHVGDDVMAVPLEDVSEADVESDRYRRYLVVDADRDDEPMTFFVDATLEGDEDRIWDVVSYLEAEGSGK